MHIQLLDRVLLERNFKITVDEYEDANITLAADMWLSFIVVFDEFVVLRSFKIRTDPGRSNLVSHTPDLILDGVAKGLTQDGYYWEDYVCKRRNLGPAASSLTYS